MLSVFLSACRTALYFYPCFTFPWSSLCLSLTSIPTTPSLIPNVLIYLSIPSLLDKVTALPFPQGECRIQFCFPVNTWTSFPSVQNISSPTFLDPHSSFLHLRCAQEVDLWGWHQWVLVQLGTSGERECLPPCQGTGVGMSLTAPTKVVNPAGCSFALWEKFSSY